MARKNAVCNTSSGIREPLHVDGRSVARLGPRDAAGAASTIHRAIDSPRASHSGNRRPGPGHPPFDPTALLGESGLVRVRRDQATLSVAERAAFNQALHTMVKEGTYNALVHVGSDSSHNRSGARGRLGCIGFCPGSAAICGNSKAACSGSIAACARTICPWRIPYWNWSGPLPTWLTDFSNDRRWLLEQAAASSPLKPTAQDIHAILHESSRQLPAPGSATSPDSPTRWKAGATGPTGRRCRATTRFSPGWKASCTGLSTGSRIRFSGSTWPRSIGCGACGRAPSRRRPGAGRARPRARPLGANCRRDASPAVDRLHLRRVRLRASGFGLQASDFRLQTSGFRLQTSDSRLQPGQGAGSPQRSIFGGLCHASPAGAASHTSRQQAAAGNSPGRGKNRY